MEAQTLEQTVDLTRDQRGFGFEVSGDKPARLTRVLKGSGAEQSGLRIGDDLIRINGESVLHFNADRVNSLLKKSGKHIQVTVRRRPEPDAALNTNSNPNSSSRTTTNDTDAMAERTGSVPNVTTKHAVNRTRLSIDAALHDSLSSIKRSIFSQKQKPPVTSVATSQENENSNENNTESAAATGKSKSRGKQSKVDAPSSKQKVDLTKTPTVDTAKTSVPPSSQATDASPVETKPCEIEATGEIQQVQLPQDGPEMIKAKQSINKVASDLVGDQAVDEYTNDSMNNLTAKRLISVKVDSRQSRRTLSCPYVNLQPPCEGLTMEVSRKRISHSEEDVRHSLVGHPDTRFDIVDWSERHSQSRSQTDEQEHETEVEETQFEPPKTSNGTDSFTFDSNSTITSSPNNPTTSSLPQLVRVNLRRDVDNGRYGQRNSLRNERRYRTAHSRRFSADVAQMATVSSIMTPALRSLEEETTDTLVRKREDDAQPSAGSNNNSGGLARLFRKSEKRKTVAIDIISRPEEVTSGEPEVEHEAEVEPSSARTLMAAARAPQRSKSDTSEPEAGSAEIDNSKNLNSNFSDESKRKKCITFATHFETPLDDAEFDFVLPSLDKLVHRDVYDALSTHEREVQKVLLELVHTERVHAHYLRVIDSVFYTVWPTSTPYVELRDMLIPDLPSLSTAHCELLSRLLRCALFTRLSPDAQPLFAAFDVCRVAQVLGTTLNDLLFAERVARFCERQNEAFTRLSEARLNDRRFAAFVQRGESNAECRHMRVNDLALIEMQRVTKYPLLIEKLVHYCEKAERANTDIRSFERLFQVETASPELEHDPLLFTKSVFDWLRGTLAASRKLLDLVNSRVREYENAARWRSLVSQVDRVSFSDFCQSYLENRRLQSRSTKAQPKKSRSSGKSKQNTQNDDKESAEQLETKLIDSLRRNLDSSQLMHSSDRLLWQLGQQRQINTIAALIRHDQVSADSQPHRCFFLLLFESVSAIQTAQVSVPAQKLVLKAHNVALSGAQSGLSSKGAAASAAFSPPLLQPLIRIDERTLVRPDAADKRAFFVVSNTQTQIHSFVAPSAEERRAWLANLENCIATCANRQNELNQNSPATSTTLAGNSNKTEKEISAENVNGTTTSLRLDAQNSTESDKCQYEPTTPDCVIEQKSVEQIKENWAEAIELGEQNPDSKTDLGALRQISNTAELEGNPALEAAGSELLAALATQDSQIKSALVQKNELIEMLLRKDDQSGESSLPKNITPQSQNRGEATDTNGSELETLAHYIRSLSAYSNTLIRSLTTINERQLQDGLNYQNPLSYDMNSCTALVDRTALLGVHDVLQRFVERYQTEM